MAEHFNLYPQSSYRVALTTSAEKELRGLPAKIVARIVARLERLASSPRPPGSKKLRGGDSEWRIRVGDYRAVYEIDDDAKTVDVTRIAHRREVYE
jgi:mRNA interferase RelE/StbE